jgi:hypothetical protein
LGGNAELTLRLRPKKPALQFSWREFIVVPKKKNRQTRTLASRSPDFAVMGTEGSGLGFEHNKGLVSLTKQE